MIAQHLSATPDAPSVYARKGWVSPAIDEVVLRALAKDPEDRYASADALREALDRALRRPNAPKALDEGVFQDARRGLLLMPDDAHADRLEELARETGAFLRAAEAFEEAARATRDREAKLNLLFRSARIYDTEQRDALRAEAAYQQILELAPGDAVALRGLEANKRASGDHEGLVGLLLDRLETETRAESKKALLHEVAGLYEKQLRSPDNALLAYTQALLNDASDQEARRNVERLAGNSQDRWGEVVEMLTQWAEQTQATLGSDEDAQRAAAQQAVEDAENALSTLEGEYAAAVTARARSWPRARGRRRRGWSRPNTARPMRAAARRRSSSSSRRRRSTRPS